MLASPPPVFFVHGISQEASARHSCCSFSASGRAQVSVYPQKVSAAVTTSLNLGHRRRALEDGARQYEPEAAAASTHTSSASAGTMATAPRKMSRPSKWW